MVMPECFVLSLVRLQDRTVGGKDLLPYICYAETLDLGFWM